MLTDKSAPGLSREPITTAGRNGRYKNYLSSPLRELLDYSRNSYKNHCSFAGYPLTHKMRMK